MANLKINTTTIQSILKTVNALPEAGSGGINPAGTINIIENGEHDVTNYAKANVNVPSTVPTGYADVSGVTATAADVLSTAKFVPKEGGDPISGNISIKSNNDLTSSGATITGPAGYYSNDISKSVATATKATPIISKTSTNKLKASYNQSAGYVTSGTVNSNEVSASSLDSNLTEDNIKNGVTIFGVQGKYSERGYIESASSASVSMVNNSSGYLIQISIPVNTNNLIGIILYRNATNDYTNWANFVQSMFIDINNSEVLVTVINLTGQIAAYTLYDCEFSLSTNSITIKIPSANYLTTGTDKFRIRPIYDH